MTYKTTFLWPIFLSFLFFSLPFLGLNFYALATHPTLSLSSESIQMWIFSLFLFSIPVACVVFWVRTKLEVSTRFIRYATVFKTIRLERRDIVGFRKKYFVPRGRGNVGFLTRYTLVSKTNENIEFRLHLFDESEKIFEYLQANFEELPSEEPQLGI